MIYVVVLPVEAGATAHAELQVGLVRLFGGYTSTEAKGAWRDPNGTLVTEPVVRYEVAYFGENPKEARIGIRCLADAAGVAGKQQEVYYASYEGKAECIKI